MSESAPPPSMALKVYLVVQDSNVGAPSKILAVKLNRSSAQRLVDRVVGARIEKVLADKV